MENKSPGKEFLAGVRAELPLLIGVIPFGMIYGVLAIGSGIPAGASQSISAIVFAGSAQLIMTQLAMQGASVFVVLITVSVINLRHLLYSASIAPYLSNLDWRWKVALAYLLTDEAYAVSIRHYQNNNEQNTRLGSWFYLGAGLALWSSWQISTAFGISLGALIPSSWSLDYTLVLTFIAILVPNLKNRVDILVALSAGLLALIWFAMPNKIGLVLAAVFAIGIGIIVEKWGKRKEPRL